MFDLGSIFKKKIVLEHHEPDPAKLPKHIAFIMDGNGRWAKKRGLARNAGHLEGSRVLKKIIDACYSYGIPYATVYAFSSENWSRPADEVGALMKLVLQYLRNAEAELEGREVRIRVIGDREGLTPEIRAEIDRVQASTAKNRKMDFLIALNYGGRQEIVHAVRRLARDAKEGRLDPDTIEASDIEACLHTAGIPDPDLVIRTSGEQRLSNFLTWQTAYSEFLFPHVLWPDFKERHLREALLEYQNRDRRYGGIKA